MPIALILVGLIVVTLAIRGTEHLAAQQLAKDFGAGSQFYTWAAAVILLGCLGYSKLTRPIVTPAIALVVLGIVLKNGGLFSQLSEVIRNVPAAVPAVKLSQYKDGSSSGAGSKKTAGLPFGDLFGGGDGGGDIGIGDVAKIASLFLG